LSAYCVRACKIKHFTEREFSGIFSLAGGGEFCVFKTGIPGGPGVMALTLGYFNDFAKPAFRLNRFIEH